MRIIYDVFFRAAADASTQQGGHITSIKGMKRSVEFRGSEGEGS